MDKHWKHLFTGVALAIAAGTAGIGCSGDAVNPTDAGKAIDGGHDGAAGDLLTDAPAADAPTAQDTLGADKGVDSAGSDAARLDGGAVDRADVAQVDAPAGDGAALDGGSVLDGSIDGGAALVARGKYLVSNVIGCSDCHTPKLPSGAPDMSLYLAGNPAFVKLPNGDVLPSRNLTPDPTTGLGQFNAAQIKQMFTSGIVPGPNGPQALNPVMPYYVFHNMTSDDADAIVAYLQSIPPIQHQIPARSASFDLPAPADYLDPTTIPTPADSYPQKASALRGRYLATESGLCIECHTPHLTTGPMPLDTSKFFQGGEDFSSLFVGTLNITPVSANLTSDPATGLGNWTTDQIVTVLLQGKDDQGTGICPPMPVGPNGGYGGLTAQDALDIANYIKSLPPAVHAVPDTCSWPPAPPVDGGGLDGGGMDVGAVDGASVD